MLSKSSFLTFYFNRLFAIREKNKTNTVFSLAKHGSEAPAIGWRPRGVVRVRENSLPAA